MKQQQRYLAIALFLFGHVLPRPVVHGFAPIPRLSRHEISTFSYPDELRTREVFEDDEGSESVEEIIYTEVQSPTNGVFAHQPPPLPSESVNGANQPQDSKQSKDMLLEDERTLYEILGAAPNATRDELKKRYVKLARETHPDATVGLSPEEREEKEILFTEVAAAWRILSDKRERKRYDRSLVAKEFTKNFEQVAGAYADKVARTAAPAVSRVLETLFRSTAGPNSTKSLNDAAEQVRAERAARKAREARAERMVQATREVKKANGKKVDVRSALASAFGQGKKLSMALDRYELLKKSRELEQM